MASPPSNTSEPGIPPSPYARLKASVPSTSATGPRVRHHPKDPAVPSSAQSSPAPARASDTTTAPTADAATPAETASASAPTPTPRPARDTSEPVSAAARRSSPMPQPAAESPRAAVQVSAPAWDTAAGGEPMLRRRPVRPKRGWQALAYNATGGMWNPGLGAKEARLRERDANIAAQLRGKHVTAFFCLKGGISKTSTTAATSIALADLRPDPVFAIDANPDAGDLAERLLGEQRAGITALAEAVDGIDSLEALSNYTATAGRLTVLPGEPNPTLGDSLGSEDFERIMNVVRRYYSFVQVDCGTGVTHPLMSGILRYADTAVIPAAWSITGAKRAAETIAWLRENGFEHLARTSIVVLTAKDIVSRNVDKEAVLRHLDDAADLVVVPADPHVADGAQLEWDMLQPATREAYLEIAAAITSRFAGR